MTVRTPYVPTIIVDRNSMFRMGLAHALAHTRFIVIRECSSISEINVAEIPPTDCVLLIGLDDQTCRSVSSILEVRKITDLLHVVILGSRTDVQELQAVMELHGKCYLLKDDITSDNLLRSLEFVMAGQVVFTHDLIRILREGWSSRRAIEAPAIESHADTDWEVQRLFSMMGENQAVCRLSERETAILMRIMHGASNKIIARELDIAEATVKVHVKSVLRKIHVKNRTQAATWAWARYSLQSKMQEQSGEPDSGISVALNPQVSIPSNGALHDEPV